MKTYELKSLITGTYLNLGTVHQIIVSGPKVDYAFLKYKDGRVHQVKCLGFSKNECKEATKIAREA